MLTTWGIYGGLLGLLNFEESALPDYKNKPVSPKRNAFFKIYTIDTQQTGLDHGDLDDAGGDQPDARLFDFHGYEIGHVFDPGTYVAPGSSQVFWAGTNGEQPIYTLFSANEDAQCIAFVTASWPDFDHDFGWVGDWGSECAGNDTSIATWYFSKIAIPGTDHFPNCMWMDLDDSQPATGFQVKWLDMKPDENDIRIGKKARDMCQTPSFNIFHNHDPAHIIYEQPGEAGPPRVERSELAPSRKRSKTPRRSAAEAKLAFQQKYGNLVVIDNLPYHTAHSLCESATSAGPSFVNPEHGFFCEMTTKTIYPICHESSSSRQTLQNRTACFDMDKKELDGPGLRKRSVPYQVQDWRYSKIY